MSEASKEYRRVTKNMTPEARKAYREKLRAEGALDADIVAGFRDEKGRYLKGMPGGPGRTPGFRQKLAETFYKKLMKAFENQGESALAAAFPAGGSSKEAIDFLKLVASMVPKQVELVDQDGETVAINAVIVPAKVPQAKAE